MNKRKIKKKMKKEKLLEEKFRVTFRKAINYTLYNMFKKAGFGGEKK